MPAVTVHNMGTAHRPVTFKSLVSPSDSVRALENLVCTQGRTSTAYLITGPFGCGKTTVAEILARHLLCKSPKEDGTPCGTCSACITPLASNTDYTYKNSRDVGIQDVRDILGTVNFRPRISNLRVVVLDEAHSLTAAAQSGLLIPIETPSTPHVVWIFSTNHPHGLREEIVSRCFRAEVNSPTLDDAVTLLRQVASAEGISVPDAALTEIARAANGHYRDALHLLHSGNSAGVLSRPDAISSLAAASAHNRTLNLLHCIMHGNMRDALGISCQSSDALVLIKLLSTYASKLAVFTATGYGLQPWEAEDYARVVGNLPRAQWTPLFFQFLPALEQLVTKAHEFTVDASVLLNNFTLTWAPAFSSRISSTTALPSD